MRRFQTMDTCTECGACGGGVCDPARVDGLRPYAGIRFTADGFDCALPVTIDSHSKCSFQCTYCFSENLTGHVQTQSKGLGQTSLRDIEAIFAGGFGRRGEHIRTALKYDRRNVNGYPCPVQLGGINDPGDNIERQQGWFLEFAKLCIKYNQPVRISTKGNTFASPDYLRVFASAPHLFWVAFSIISPDDELLSKIDMSAPPPTERLRTMAALSKVGVSTSLRFRPMFPGVSDRTPRYPQAYRVLIERAAAAGARAISYECGFYPSRIPTVAKEKWDGFARLINVPLKSVYRQFGLQACTRPSYMWTENIMHAVKEVALQHGLTVGVSDPVWKQLSDVGCCCGIRDDDPVFGNWERENATLALINARDNPEHIMRVEEIIPAWAEKILQGEMCNMGAGPKLVWKKRRFTWADKLREIWNEPACERSPLTYFQGAVIPVRLDDGAMGYKYRGLSRQNLERVPYWKVDADLSKPAVVPGKVGKAKCRFASNCDRQRCPKCIDP